jgi:hypothetical protein
VVARDAVEQHPDSASLLDHHLPPRVAGRCGQVDGLREGADPDEPMLAGADPVGGIALDAVRSGRAEELVGRAVGVPEHVGAGAPVQCVGAAAAGEPVVVGAGRERVGSVPACDGVAAGARGDVLDVGGHVVALAASPSSELPAPMVTPTSASRLA